MADRQCELSHLKAFIGKVDTELTIMLQHLQWDRKHLEEGKQMVGCRHDDNHKIPESTKDIHEQKCLLAKHGYSEEDLMLPDPLDNNADTLIKYSKTDIEEIINMAACNGQSFRRGVSSTQASESSAVPALEPLSLARLQATYTPGERRVLHDAVVLAAPLAHDLADLALLSENGEASSSTKPKSRVEILAELRDMKRRRTKYRVSAKTRNYSHVLRDVIKTQMEVYSEVKVEVKEEFPSQYDTSSKRKDQYSKEDRYQPSKYLKNHSYRDKESDANVSRHIHKRDESRRDYNGDNSSSLKRSRMNDPVRYPDPRKYKEDRYNNDQSDSKRRKHYDHDDYSGRKYDGRKSRKERSHETSSKSKTRLVEVKQEVDSDSEASQKTQYQEDIRHSSRCTDRYDESYYRNDRRKYDERSKEYKRDRYEDRSKDGRKHGKYKEDKYRRETYTESYNFIKVEKYED